MAARTHRWILASAIAVAGFAGTASADDAKSGATWYIVGGPEVSLAEQLGLERQSRADFGISVGDMMTFTPGSVVPSGQPGEGYSLLLSGSYGFETGTLVTPRVMGGLGVSYPGGAAGGTAGIDPTVTPGMTPTARIGFGADFDLGGPWGFSAEYSATYLGEAERQGQPSESRVDQKFTVGAKVRF